MTAPIRMPVRACKTCSFRHDDEGPWCGLRGLGDSPLELEMMANEGVPGLCPLRTGDRHVFLETVAVPRADHDAVMREAQAIKAMADAAASEKDPQKRLEQSLSILADGVKLLGRLGRKL